MSRERNRMRVGISGGLVLTLGMLPMLTGCDQLSGITALMKTTATAAVQGAAVDLVQSAIDGIVGNVLPDATGA